MIVRIQSIVRQNLTSVRSMQTARTDRTNVVRSDRIDLSNFVLWIAIMCASEMMTVGHHMNVVIVTLAVHV